MFRTPIYSILFDRHVERCADVAERLEDEASEHALAGNPRRAGYLETWAQRFRQLPWQMSR